MPKSAGRGRSSGGHSAVVIPTAAEHKLARLLASGFYVIVDGLPCLLSQLKPDGSTGLLLPHRRAIDRIPDRCNVLDPKCDDIAARSLLSIARLNIAKSRVRPSICSRVRIDLTNMFWPQRRLLADELALVPGISSRRRGHRLCLNLHGYPPGLVRHDQDAEAACPNEQRTSAFDALRLPEVRARRTRLTQSGDGLRRAAAACPSPARFR